MKKRTLLWLALALVVFGGGAWMAQETNTTRAKASQSKVRFFISFLLYSGI